jgi:seryl-tRNA synthetase
MRDLGLDFQPRRLGLLPVVLLLAGGVLAVDAGLELKELGRQQEALAAQVQQAQRRADRQARDDKPGAALSSEQDKALRQAAASIAIDWEALYRHIDRATQEDVALLAIVPNVVSKSLQISGEARNLPAALAFVEALRRPPLTQATLLSHQTRNEDGQHPVVFEISATWNLSL